jgi:hypothetical protein
MTNSSTLSRIDFGPIVSYFCQTFFSRNSLQMKYQKVSNYSKFFCILSKQQKNTNFPLSSKINHQNDNGQTMKHVLSSANEEEKQPKKPASEDFDGHIIVFLPSFSSDDIIKII